MQPASHPPFRSRLTLSDMPRGQRRAVILGLATASLLFLMGFLVNGYFWTLSFQFPKAPFKQPSRLYAMPTRIAPGATLSPSDLVAELRAAKYRRLADGEAAESAALPPGTFRRDGERVSVHLRRFLTPEGEAGGERAEIRFQGGRIRELRVDGQPAQSITLEPPLLASFYGPDLSERRPVRLDELPDEVVKAVLAAEDDAFYMHAGVSPTGIARALWVNLRGGETQGGSTITQQLVKNVYLTSKRSLVRKGKEALIAVFMEVRYSKDQILEAYLNEIYWGKSGPANILGLGAASRAYFSKDASQLTLEEAATLAGMIQAPATYLPTRHPEKAMERRDWVLQRMKELGWITEERLQQALATPIRVVPEKVVPRPFAPYFAEAVEAEADERFGIDNLPDEGYVLFSTVRWRDQRQAERAVASGLATLEGGLERIRRGKEPLQAALISVDPGDGAILAYVGGRDFSVSQFDRVSKARRQAGSTFKPVVYAAAFAEAVASPATLLKDSPITVKAKGMNWKPQNYDRGFRGPVTARTALEQSLNIPTVRLALQVGLSRIIELARDMGLEGNFEPVPALALGAFEATPYQMAVTYATFANGGSRPALHGVAAAFDREGEAILGDDPPAPQRVMPPQAAYVVTSMLQGALDRGTATPARSFGVRDRLAGKTGTTNDRRDNWFAGYSPDRVTVVWVGYDDNARTKLSGARAALPIWSRFTLAVRPPGGYPTFVPPQGIVTVAVDPATGQIATEACPHRISEIFPEWQAPAEPCRLHGAGPEMWANANPDGIPIDPVTGEPLYSPSHDDYGYGDPAGDPAGAIPDFGYGYGRESYPGEPGTEPVPVDLSELEEEESEDDGSILIRPTRPRPAAAPPVQETPVEGVDPAEIEPEPAPETPAEELEPAPEETAAETGIEVEAETPPPPPPAESTPPPGLP